MESVKLKTQAYFPALHLHAVKGAPLGTTLPNAKSDVSYTLESKPRLFNIVGRVPIAVITRSLRRRAQVARAGWAG